MVKTMMKFLKTYLNYIVVQNLCPLTKVILLFIDVGVEKEKQYLTIRDPLHKTPTIIKAN